MDKQKKKLFNKYTYKYVVYCKCKGKVHPITGQEGPDVE